MQIAILLYDRFTALDAVGPYEVLARMPDTTVVFVSERPGPVRADTGMLALTADAALAEVPHPDIVLVPGGPGQDDQMSDGAVHQWLRAADAASSWTSSVCTGSLILAAAGLLAGRRATSHWLALDELRQFGVTPVSQRVVMDGKFITAAGVSAGIDMALGLAGRIGGKDAGAGHPAGHRVRPAAALPGRLAREGPARPGGEHARPQPAGGRDRLTGRLRDHSGPAARSARERSERTAAAGSSAE